ncbi:hypothetical protein DXF87_26110, partial [Enterobacter roggenkampii]
VRGSQAGHPGRVATGRLPARAPVRAGGPMRGDLEGGGGTPPPGRRGEQPFFFLLRIPDCSSLK